MPIAFRAEGARLKTEITAGNGLRTVAMPPGIANGDLVLLVVVHDDNTGPTATPAGWTLLGSASAGQSTTASSGIRVQTRVFYRVAGSTNTAVPLSFSTAAWPAGCPYVLAFTVAYSGIDKTAPVEKWQGTGTSSTAANRPHPQITTAADGDWLVTLRTGAAWQARTVSISGGTNAERVDDTDGFGELFAALYDSSDGLPPGAQTVRFTTTAGGDALCQGGSTMWSLALKPASTSAVTLAVPGVAGVAASAYDAAVQAEPGGWNLCGVDGLPRYRVRIDWEGDGTFDGEPDDVTGDIISEITVNYGRDQDRQLAPASTGSASVTLNNSHRRYSPENAAGPLYGELDPARPMRAEVEFNGRVHPLFTGKIDDFDVHADFTDRTAGFSFLDGFSDLAGMRLSTGVCTSQRTGDLIETVLDTVGWTGGRDIDQGATVVRYWWAEGVDALTAINDLVRSEGPPAVAYIAPDGTFTFRDRHHRLQRQQSLTARATFVAGRLGECGAEDVQTILADEDAGPGYRYTKPFTYSHGWRDIVNSVSFDVEERVPAPVLETVWTDESSYTLEAGQSVELEISASEPFIDAVTPVPGTDVLYTAPGAGTVAVVLNRSSGASTQLSLRAVGGPVLITYVQLRARPLAVQRTARVSASDPGSISRHGEKAYPDGAPWAGVHDAEAIANMILLHYARRRPTVQIRVASQDPAHFMQVVQRTVSDRIRIVNGEMGLDDDFFVERVTHTIRRFGREGRPPVHEVVLGCEQDLVISTNPFTFDQRGSGFDQGTFDLVAEDDPGEVFVFDDPVRGQFDRGRLGT